MLIPNNLVTYAEIQKDIVFIGMSNRIEVWSSKKWEDYNEEEFDTNSLAI